jgi:nitrate reductase beta subunit
MTSCPSGAIYKRDEDGIVLIDQEQCRGWRMCVSGCPYKKVYFNWQTGKSEKCTLCYPRIEAGLPTICSETCVGRIRYLGPVLYDADRVADVISSPEERDLYEAQLGLFMDPEDPHVREQARRGGVPDAWIEAARRSPVYALAVRHRVALPLHPEYRTLPMVWYVPPLSPVMGMIEGDGSQADPDDVFAAIDQLRIPVKYLANLLTAGDEDVIRRVLHRLAAMRRYMRQRNLGEDGDLSIPGAVGMTREDMDHMYRLLAIAKYEDRFVVPPTHREAAGSLADEQGSCGLDFAGGPGGCGVLGRAKGSGRS